MLLIIFLGLIAMLTLVSGDCNYGTTKVKDFDWNKFSGLWYSLLHITNDFESKIDCPQALFSRPEGNRSNITSHVYDISEKRHIKAYGYATNWNSSGYFELRHSVPMWNGRLYVLAIDYDRYIIGKLCSFDLNKTYVYVLFRSQNPDEATEKEVLKVLQDNKIDGSQFVEMKADHCQEVE